ncbi:2-C-methyl-D-erythritol 4-phosphate cytidylyltransferase [Paludisphaera borealis]|uniref:2-C-methyl-D-erythritol 4-phosphate cytidylyltransferase n=1 Tax=Paludisphaera borealis TaxID=1387353 RepID=A0A1U7CMK7_9BACT|nr:2-C-methyl-D-erythritol 4-phosphate cytidylyltransferase [Paludisphaera borealis]APW60146.1 2-C-methyl-D-erythritol 4-phosphate cytidylyltransferase [Paludisphaera borealis]
MGRFAVILPAAGRSSRFGDPKQKKIYAEIEGRAVWLRSVDPFLKHDDVAQIIVAIAEEDQELFDRRYRESVAFLGIDVIVGGAERSDTVASALERVKPECDFVAVHDAARPCLTADQVAAVFKAAEAHGAALLATPVFETIKRANADRLTTETVSRDNLFLAQTPQVFRRDWLVEAYARRAEHGKAATDDTQLVEAIGHPCAIVPGSSHNLKITTQDDLAMAKAVLDLREKARPAACGHPYADEQAMWNDLPRLKPSDLFGG